MSKLSSFLNKHADELKSVGNIFSTILFSLPLVPSEKASVIEAVKSLDAAADAIKASVKSVQVADAKAIKEAATAAAKEAVPSIIASVVAAEVAKQLEKLTK